MTAQEYDNKEKKLEEIEKRLNEIVDTKEISMVEVLSLRDEARSIAQELNAFLSENFKH